MGICVVWYISVLPRTEHYSPSYRKSDAETERKEEKMRRGALANSSVVASMHANGEMPLPEAKRTRISGYVTNLI